MKQNGRLSEVHSPLCSGCPNNYFYHDAVPKRQFGVMMHMGEHFCIGGKRARRFRKNDPKNHVPEWCPQRKKPCELRIYGFKNEGEKLLHSLLCHSIGTAIFPSAGRYAVVHESHTELTAQDFWKRCQLEPTDQLLSVAVDQYQVVEIDDGLMPCFFYKTDKGFENKPTFNAKEAKKNTKEDVN